ncbi:MAG: histidine kinase [Lachnospiraceae bacterium]|nr:histidine kinase [Lachnospiraceae bacterium]
MTFSNINTRNLIFRLVTIILVPAMILIAFYNFYTFRSLTDDFVKIDVEHASALQSEMDEKISLINSYLVYEASTNDFATICYDTDDVFNRNLSLSNIINRFSQKILDIPEIAALFVVSDAFCRDRYNSYISYNESSGIKSYVKATWQGNSDTVSQSTYATGWQSCRIGAESYLAYTYYRQNVKLICFFSLEQLYQSIFTRLYEEHTCVISDAAGNILFSCPELISLNTDVLQKDKTNDTQTFSDGRFLYALAFSQYTDFIIISISRLTDIFGNVTILQILLLLLSVLLVLTVPLYFFLLNHFYLKPMKQLTSDMLRMQENNEIIHLDTSYNIQEFTLFQKTLNDLLEKITILNRNYYEKELESQKVRLQCYRLQLKPHFYLNCLKQVYSLLNQGKHDEAENALFYFAGYLRYILKDNVSLIPLSGEMECIANYVKLRNIGSTHPIVCSLQIDDSLKDCPVPMLLLETFLENSVKYATLPDAALQIDIEGYRINDGTGEKAYFCIRDNGKGFDDDTLNRYNLFMQTGGTAADQSRGIGIFNIMQRCHILYQGREFFHFSNQGGATIEIMIPLTDHTE